jgi:hypothetical protein
MGGGGGSGGGDGGDGGTTHSPSACVASMTEMVTTASPGAMEQTYMVCPDLAKVAFCPAASGSFHNLMPSAPRRT